MKTLIKGAHILTMDDHYSEHDCADILVEGTKIAAIGPNLPIPQNEADLNIIEASGMLAMPGLVNGHIHSPANFQKGTLDGMPLEVFMLYEVPPLSDNPPSPRLNYVRTMLGNMEMLKLGVTAVHDDAFYVPLPTPEAIDGLMQSYADSGIRVAATLDQPMVVEYEKYPFLYDILPAQIRQDMESAPRQSKEDLLALYDHLIKRWHDTSDGRVRTAVSISAPQRVTTDYFGALSEISQNLNLPFDIHMLETKLQRVLGEEKYGKSLIKYVHDLGFLTEQVMVIHAIWVDDKDIDLISQAGCSVAHNPGCNLRLGSGVMPFRKLRKAGIPICLGSDEAIAEDTANMWTIGKLAGLLHNISDPEYHNWPQAREILWSLTRGGARAMRNEGRVGVLAPGYEADLILLDLNTLTFTPLNDIYRQLVYSETGSSVRLTIVAGQVVMKDGQLLTIDEKAIKQEARELMKEYKIELTKAAEAAAKLEPYYREMYLRSTAVNVGMNRWIDSSQ
ncbi:MAG: amidohydrolase family protein [Ardenticatenaceae bacterium]|nr:amidohydrolase family protein [Ardenticatenaceae bacterium]MCB9443484.1 amidohydrolase family protein [Ardenticatenaceae bacterium]